MSRLFALVSAAALGLSLLASAAQAGSCPDWMCGSNGQTLNGRPYNAIKYNGRGYNGRGYNGRGYNSVFQNGVRQQVEVEQPAVTAVILPSGETVDLR